MANAQSTSENTANLALTAAKIAGAGCQNSAMTENWTAEIRRVLNDAGRLPVDASTLDEHADLYLVGMSSHASVDVMLELEETFEIEFPPQMLNRSVFESIAAIATAVDKLKRAAA